MIRKISLTALILTVLTTIAPAQTIYNACISEHEILTPAPSPRPRINGPQIYGARPNRQFVFRIPCQGQRPIQFSVTNLPPSLKLDTRSGVISGRTPASPGTFKMTFNAKNDHGTASRPFKLVVGDKIALTPPVGFNTWGGHMLYVSDELIRRAADLFVDKGFADVGFQYISIDDCWMRISPQQHASFNDARKRKYEGFDYTGIIGTERAPDGSVLPNAHFPDMKAMTDYLHQRGLKAGIYSSPGRYTCQLFCGSKDHLKQDADQYARWGFDLLKFDLCSGSKDLQIIRKQNPQFSQAQYWKPMADYIRNQDRDIFFNLCQYGREAPWTWAPALGIQSWRTGGDLNHHVDTYFQQALRLASDLRQYSKPGQWNDPDFMYIHKIRDYRKMANPTREIPLDTNQRYQYVTLWSMICAPFFFSCDLDQIDPFTIALLTNADVLNINQDQLARVARVIRNRDHQVIMTKELANHATAVAIFNTDPLKDAVIPLDFSEFNQCCLLDVYDVWRQKIIGPYKNSLSIKLSPNGVALLIFSQPQ